MKKKLILSYTLIAIIILSACSSKKETENNTNAKENTAKESGTSKIVPNTNNEKATVSFKVNGINANTKMGNSNDNAAQSGMINRETNFFSLTLNGDDPKFPHRGYLNISIENYTMQTGVFKSSIASFSRYETSNAGGETQYDVKQGGNCSFTIESIVKTSAASDPFEEYTVSGTFSGKFGLKQGWNNDVKEINITDGIFKDVRVSVLGRKK